MQLSQVWAEVVKLLVIHGITALKAAYADKILPLAKLRSIVGGRDRMFLSPCPFTSCLSCFPQPRPLLSSHSSLPSGNGQVSSALRDGVPCINSAISGLQVGIFLALHALP